MPGHYMRCQAIVPDAGGNKRECGNHESHTDHRTYPCREKGCTAAGGQFPSIEMRDKHEAIEHGGGW